MLKCCAYCQSFLGEIQPYNNFDLTHGICSECEAAYPNLFDARVVLNAKALRSIFRELFEAGRRNDVELAERLIEQAWAAKFKPIDILLGLISPMLYKIGADWERDQLTIEGEHRFTTFCERVVNLISCRLLTDPAKVVGNEQIVVVNAPGNLHTLGVHVLRLWLESRGHRTSLVGGNAEVVISSILRARPKFLLMSIALPEQANSVLDLVERLRAAAPSVAPKVVVGGYAVKVGAVAKITGADLCPDINLLRLHDAL